MSQHSYRQTFKTVSLFGSVQIFSILINLIKHKAAAILLGTTGYGINSLFQSPLSVISSLTNLGIAFSAIRDIAPAYSKGDMQEFSMIVRVLKRWVWITGLIGLFITVLLSPLLSQWVFGDKNQTFSFICLSVILLLTAVNGGQIAIIQGVRKHKEYAKSITLSSLVGLLAIVPLYYFFGIQGIVPALIISAIISTVFSWYYSGKISVSPVELSRKDLFDRGKAMIKLGIMFNLGALVSLLTFFLTSLFITNRSGEDQVGLFTGGWNITNQYVGLIFSAMAVDYFPKLVGSQGNTPKMKQIVNEQGEIAIMIVAPLIVLYITFLPIIIKLLLVSDFMPILQYSRWLIIGMLIKTASWALGYVTLAKGDTKFFLILEIITNGIFLAGSVIGYYLGELEGIGIGIVVCFFLNYTLMSIVIKMKYKIAFSKEFQKIFLLHLFIIIITFIFVCFVPLRWMYAIGSVIFLFSFSYSFMELDKRLDLRKAIISKLKNR